MRPGESGDNLELRLCLLAPGEIFGGAERQMLTLVEWLLSAGVRPVVALFHDATLAHELRSLKVDVTILSSAGTFDRRAVGALRQLLLSHRCNVLHYHGYRPSVHAFFAVRGLDMRIIRIKHGLLDPRWRDPMTVIKAAVYGTCDVLVTRLMATRLIYVSEDLKRHLRGAYAGMPHDVIYNGIGALDATRFARPREYSPSHCNALILARIEAVKGIEFAIRALALEATPAQVMLHIVGEGRQLRELQRLVDRLQLAERVKFHGFRRNAYDYLAHADVSLLPSLHEGLPYSLLETMALRVPLIASRVGGLKEVLEHEQTALLVPRKDPGAIAAALARMCNEPGVRARLVANAAQLVATRFSAGAMGRAYLDVYSGELERWRA